MPASNLTGVLVYIHTGVIQLSSGLPWQHISDLVTPLAHVCVTPVSLI